MRLKKWGGLFATLLALAGCVASTTTNNPLVQNVPKENKQEEAREAARIHTELGQQYMIGDDLQTAQEKLNMALKFDPDYAPAHTVLAVLDERINRPDEAEQHFRRAAALQPDKGEPANNLGQFLCMEGKYAEGESYFAKALADPFYATPSLAWTNDGTCRMRAGDRAGAQNSLRKALQLDPRNADALFQLANLLYLNNDALLARGFLRRYEALGQASPAAIKLGYSIESQLGNTDAALIYRKRLQAQFPDSDEARSLDSSASR